VPEQPRAPRRPKVLVAHGDERVDDWHWLRDREDPEVLRYLEAENAYTEALMEPTAALQESLFAEIKARVQETDLTAPTAKGPWWYYSRTVEGSQYRIYCRRSRRGPSETAVEAMARTDGEQVLLDENALAEGHDYFALGAFRVSPDHRLLAYSTDVAGDEVYTLRARDLETGADLPDEVPNTYYGVAWANDCATLFYTTLDEAKRPWRAHRHRLGTDAGEDVLVHQEDDRAFHLGVGKTKTEAFVVLFLHTMVTTEVRVVPGDEPESPARVVGKRRHGIEYSVDHLGDRFLIVTNDGAENFKLVEAPVDTPGPEHWRDLVPHRDDVRFLDVEVFAGHLVLHERADAVTRLRVLRLVDGDVHTVDQPEEVHVAWPGPNPELESTTLRFGYTSLVTPESVFDYDLEDRSRLLVKQQPVLGGYEPDAYTSERLWATAPDGARVPISAVWRKDRGGDGPALLYGYGAYEISVDPRFSSLRLSLLDRGFVFAIAHVRGGGEMGRRWYEEGKLLRKRNTFTDFIACAEHLVAEGLTSPEGLVIRGGSAGGLTMGAVTNMRPDLFRAVVAEVPFVDVLTTILDESLPLTVIEWEEWGDPVADPEVYFYIKSYSPYDNVEAKDYPAIFVRAGLNDPRVSYWEPAKWVAKLRATRTDDDRLLLKTDLGAGHGGPSGRYDAWRDEALVQAFVLDTVGIGA
jgi:oligopeptidase B